jgi:hypothetical protein
MSTRGSVGVPSAGWSASAACCSRGGSRNDHGIKADAEQGKDQEDDRYDDERRGPTEASP